MFKLYKRFGGESERVLYASVFNSFENPFTFTPYDAGKRHNQLKQ